MRPARIAFIVLLMLVGVPAFVRAQSRGGEFWMSGGVGGGWTRVSCAICTPARTLGPTAHVRVGASLRPGMLLGAEANGWTRNRDEGGRAWSGSIGAVAFLYPKPEGPFFVKAGVGYMTYRADEGVNTGNVGVQLGAGYEFRVGGSLYLTNYANLHASSFGSLRADGAVAVDDVSLSMLQIGVGITRR